MVEGLQMKKNYLPKLGTVQILAIVGAVTILPLLAILVINQITEGDGIQVKHISTYEWFLFVPIIVVWIICALLTYAPRSIQRKFTQ